MNANYDLLVAHFVCLFESEDGLEKYQNITSIIFLATVVYILVTMQLLGLTFILYVLKLSAGNG